MYTLCIFIYFSFTKPKYVYTFRLPNRNVYILFVCQIEICIYGLLGTFTNFYGLYIYSSEYISCFYIYNLQQLSDSHFLDKLYLCDNHLKNFLSAVIPPSACW